MQYHVKRNPKTVEIMRHINCQSLVPMTTDITLSHLQNTWLLIPGAKIRTRLETCTIGDQYNLKGTFESRLNFTHIDSVS